MYYIVSDETLHTYVHAEGQGFAFHNQQMALDAVDWIEKQGHTAKMETFTDLQYVTFLQNVLNTPAAMVMVRQGINGKK